MEQTSEHTTTDMMNLQLGCSLKSHQLCPGLHPKERADERKKKEGKFALIHVHAVSNLTADWSYSLEGSLKGRRMPLGISPALKSAAL